MAQGGGVLLTIADKEKMGEELERLGFSTNQNSFEGEIVSPHGEIVNAALSVFEPRNV